MPIRLTISEKMEERGISVRELATKADIAYNTALALKRNSSTRIDFDTLEKLCRFFNTTAGDLIVFTENPSD